MVAISYDAPEVIRHFAARKGGFSYPLLADPDSEIIRAFGILNHNYPEGDSGFGMAFPGTFVVDAERVVLDKFFEQMHRQRYTAETVLLDLFDVGGGKRIEMRNERLAMAAYLSQDLVRPGNRIQLRVDIDLPAGMHLYAPGTEGYRPVTLRLGEHPMLTSSDTRFPEPEILFLPAIEERVPVYEDQVSLTRELTVSPRLREETFRIEAEVEYQVCSDEICYPPARQPLVFDLAVEQHDLERVPESLRRANQEG